MVGSVAVGPVVLVYAAPVKRQNITLFVIAQLFAEPVVVIVNLRECKTVKVVVRNLYFKTID
jgi:hypothetical protein